MAGRTISTIGPESLPVRVNTSDEEDWAEAESESSIASSGLEEDVDLELDFPQQVAVNAAYLNSRLLSWKTETATLQSGLSVLRILKPTLSKIQYKALNPYTYGGLREIESLDALASLIHSPANWKEHYDRITADGPFEIPFSELPQQRPSEEDLQMEFAILVGNIALLLKTKIRVRSERKVMVGGILARHDCDVHGATDPLFVSRQGHNLIASEVKSNSAFEAKGQWFKRTRCPQVLAALYAYDCPTFLLSQTRWKLFVENPGRNAVYTFPYGDPPNSPCDPSDPRTEDSGSQDSSLCGREASQHSSCQDSETQGDSQGPGSKDSNSTEPDIPQSYSPFLRSCLMGPMDSTLLKVIVICLLSDKTSLANERASLREKQSVLAGEKGKQSAVQEKNDMSVESRVRALNLDAAPEIRTAATRSGSPLDASCLTSGEEVLQPVFLSGYDDQGAPMYTPVRVYPPDAVAQFEEEVLAKTKLEVQAVGSSDMTLGELAPRLG